jgi:hypothetical protein
VRKASRWRLPFMGGGGAGEGSAVEKRWWNGWSYGGGGE